MAKERGRLAEPWAYVFDDDLKEEMRQFVEPVAKIPFAAAQLDGLEAITTHYVDAMDRAAQSDDSELRKRAKAFAKRARALRETCVSPPIRPIVVRELGEVGLETFIEMLQQLESQTRWKTILPGAKPEEEDRAGREKLAKAQFQADLDNWWLVATGRRATSTIQHNHFMKFMDLVNAGLRPEYRMTVSRDALDRRKSQAGLPQARRNRLIAARKPHSEPNTD